MHSLSEDLGLAGLGIAEVHGLVEQLVDHDEVVSDALLLQLAEVILEHLSLSRSSGCRVWSETKLNTGGIHMNL